jgi:quercetin dioxygenase-like cupin family protein
MANYSIAQLDEIESRTCPCGLTRRAFVGEGEAPGSVHLVDIQEDARTHYHKAMTEIYLVLEGEGSIELDGQTFKVRPMTTIMIKPGCRHRAVGKLKIINIVIPVFDAADEWFD